MTKREAKELLPTMKVKANEDDELAFPFRECDVVIISVSDLKTDFGDKVIAIVESNKQKFNLFLNATSQKNMIEAWSDEDDNWKGKKARLVIQKNEKFKSNMIVVVPIK